MAARPRPRRLNPPEGSPGGGSAWAWWIATVLATILTLALFQRWGRPYLNVENEGTVQIPVERAPALAATISLDRLKATVERLAGFGSRLTGSPGADAAANHLKAELRAILGKDRVREETFDVDNPYDLGTEMEAGGARFRVHPFWAPVVGTYRLPDAGRALGPALHVTLERLLRGPGELAGRAAVIRWPGKEDLRALVLAASRVGAFSRDAKDPLTHAEAATLAKSREALGPEDAPVLDLLAEKHQAVLVDLFYERAGAAGLRSLIITEPVTGAPVRVAPRTFHDRLMKHPSLLPRYLVGASDARALTDGAALHVRQAFAALTLPSGEVVRVHAVWPNLVRTATTPRGGLTGPLVLAGHGSLDEVRGKRLAGAIVLVDFNCGYEWVELADQGARAILFAEPREIMRGESENKYLSLPANIPRYWVPRGDVAKLRALEGRTVRLDAQIVWERRSGRTIIGTLPGTKPDADPDPVIIEAHYDSVSVVPDIAPGGEQACGAAALLELARVLKAHPLKKTTLFVLTAGHAQNMKGWAEFLHRHAIALDKSPKDPDRINPAFVVDLDLTTRTRRLGVFFKAHRFDQQDGPIRRVYSTFGKNHAEAGAKVAKALGYGDAFMVDAVNAVSGRTWDSYMPGRFALAQELTVSAGFYGLAYVTPDDERVWVDTPHDTPDRMDFESLARQVRVLACVLPNQLNVGAAFSSSKVARTWTDLKARVVEFDPTVSYLPDRPVMGSMVWVHNYSPNKSLKGVRGDWFIQATPPPVEAAAPPRGGRQRKSAGAGLGIGVLLGLGFAEWMRRRASLKLPLPRSTWWAAVIVAGALGAAVGVLASGAGPREAPGASFEVHGLPNTSWLATGWWAHVMCEAYELDPMDGSIRYAPDRGPQGSQQYALDTEMNEAEKSLMLVTFPCRSLLMFDLIDPLRYSPFYRMATLDARTDSEPSVYGQSIPEPNWYASYVEPLAMAYAPEGSRLKATFTVNLMGKRGALVHALPDKPEGDGYAVDETDRINFTALRMAEDMTALNGFRLANLKHHGVVNHFLEGLQAEALARIEAAKAALARRDYRAATAEARAGWGLAARVYPEVERTAADVVKSAMLFLALLIPFAFLAERLFFGFPNVTHQVGGVLGIFLAMFGILRLVHPAFQIALTPVMILLAFVIIVLSVVVSAMIGARFFNFLREEREAMQGVHQADVSKSSVAMAAFALGVSNMRKRALRTTLTCMTLVALTFAVLSLTSVIQAVKQKKFSIGKVAAYEGMLFRATNWTALGEPALRHLETELAGSAIPVPRAWYVSYAADRQNAVEIAKGDTWRATAVAALGVADGEAAVTHLDASVTAGRWIRTDDTRVCLLPKAFAATLYIGPADLGHTQVVIFGVPFTVVGLFDPKRFMAVRDLDDEQLSPVNFEATEKRRQTANITSMQPEGQLPQKYDHHDAGQMVIMPFNDLMRLGGKLSSIAVPIGSPERLQTAIDKLLSRLGLLVYVGLDHKTYAYSAIGDTASEGMGYLFVPVLIAAFIVFSTMLGAVQERTREIGVYSSVGLSPNHVAILFIAEACVYAIIGAVIGYLLGQGFSHLIVSGKVLPGLNVNYSSDSAILSVVIVMIVVLISTAYPAWLARKLAQPSTVTGFVLPPLVGDRVRLELPFSFNARDAQAVCAFLAEFFDAHAEASAGEFSAGSIRLTEQRGAWTLHARVWLAPYDFGVSQDLAFSMREGIGDSSSADLEITRLSGDQASWRRVNVRFLKGIRKQFLIWRSLGEPARIGYFKTARVLEGKEAAHAA